MNSILLDSLLVLNNPYIIDIRNYYYYSLGHIRGAVSVPYYELLANHSYYLNKDDIYYLYCDTGEQSLEVSNRLNSFGYNTYSVIGGYLEYKEMFDD